ncbi:UDP-3-O-(3-hydroxymyristoyl)glucosamine N-acyltransferase [Candidatus Kinetoplastidibacterium desouzai]|nr:UDP-3-O-(3-hydroxymyristoyl)glucosamine N-acyltransferase [Candidatus Kinetoplastibacterium desouzaii]
MPIILDEQNAVSITELLNSIKSDGINWSLKTNCKLDNILIRGISSLSSASFYDVSFFINNKYRKDLLSSNAGVVIVHENLYTEQINRDLKKIKCFIVSDNPYLLYSKIATWFDKIKSSGNDNLSYIDSSSHISPTADIAEGVRIGPFCVIGSNVKIGEGSIIEASSIISSGSIIGKNCKLFPRVTLYKDVLIGDNNILHTGVVLGADGFGYAIDKRNSNVSWSKIPQLGSVIIGNNVEIGANTTVDRGSLDNTLIENGVKIDNQVMIGHNVSIGEHTAIAACVGIAGSTFIGKRCTIGGAAMISGHLHISDDVHISGGTTIISNIIKSGKYTGIYPFSRHIEWQRNAPVISHLANLRRKIKFS